MDLSRRIAKLCKEAEKEGYISLKEDPLKGWWKLFTEEPWTVLVIGEYNAGKSQLINALLGTKVVDVGPTPTTFDFKSYKVWDGLEVIDSPGFNDPGLVDAKRQKFEAELKENLKRADTVLVVVSSQSAEQADLYSTVSRTLEGKPVIGVVNIKDSLEAHEKNQLLESQKAKFLAVTRNPALEIFLVNAESALRAKLDGKLKLLEESGIQSLEDTLRTRERKFRENRKNADKELLRAIIAGTEKKAKEELRAMALLAEAQVLQCLRKEGRNILLDPEFAIVRGKEREALEEIIRRESVVEIRPKGDKTYLELLDAPEDERVLIRGLHSLEFSSDLPVAAICGVELQGCSIERSGGDLFVVASDLSKSTIKARDRANVWLGKVILGEHFLQNSVSVEDRTALWANDIVVHGFGGVCKADPTSTVQIQRLRRGWDPFVSGKEARDARKIFELVNVFRLSSVPEPLRAFGLFKGYIYAGIGGKALELYDVTTGRLCDRWHPVIRSQDGKLSRGNISSVTANEHAGLLLIASEESPQVLHLATVQDGKWAGWGGFSGNTRLGWVSFDRAVGGDDTCLMITDVGDLWVGQGRDVLLYDLRSQQKPKTPVRVISLPDDKVRITSMAGTPSGEVLLGTEGEGLWKWQIARVSADGTLKLVASEEGWDCTKLLLSPDGDRLLLHLYLEQNRRRHWKAISFRLDDPAKKEEIPLETSEPSFVSWLQGGLAIGSVIQKDLPAIAMFLPTEKNTWEKRYVKTLDCVKDVKVCSWSGWRRVAVVDSEGFVAIYDVNAPDYSDGNAPDILNVNTPDKDGKLLELD
jgi:GTP-binding protein EngB required for normal cell division